VVSSVWEGKVESSHTARSLVALAYLAALGAGVGLALVKVLYSFFPLFNVTDAVVFGGVGMLLGRGGRGIWWLRAVLLPIPGLVLSVLFSARLGLSQLRAGIGVGWLVSAAVVPAAAIAGAYLGARQRRGRSGLSESEGE
jgi:hypothetical protein